MGGVDKSPGKPGLGVAGPDLCLALSFAGVRGNWARYPVRAWDSGKTRQVAREPRPALLQITEAKYQAVCRLEGSGSASPRLKSEKAGLS